MISGKIRIHLIAKISPQFPQIGRYDILFFLFGKKIFDLGFNTDKLTNKKVTDSSNNT